MGRVKAYSLNGRFVVQFYDSGDSRHLHCPHCSWSGNLELKARSSQPADCHEHHCKRCGAVLAMVSSEMESFAASQSIFQ